MQQSASCKCTSSFLFNSTGHFDMFVTIFVRLRSVGRNNRIPICQ